MNEKKKENEIIQDEIGMTSIKRNKMRYKKKRTLSFTPDKVLTGIIYSEILGKPKGRRGW